MTGTDKDGLGEEPQRGFAADYSLDAYTAVQGLVLLSYGYRCALTGAQFGPPSLHLHPDLDVVAIKPLRDGGSLSITNFLPVLASLNRPFTEGLITVEDNYRIVVPRADLLDRELIEGLRGKLVVPDDVLLRPDPESLAHHRRFALGR